MGKKISHLQKFGHFSLTKFYVSQVSQKALFIPLKFYFENRKLINGQVNWFIKTNVSVEVFLFFFTTTVSVTDQFWLISGRVTDWFWLISFNDNCSFFFITAFFVVQPTVFVILKRINTSEKEMAIDGFRSAGITEAIVNAKDMVEKVENLFKKV